MNVSSDWQIKFDKLIKRNLHMLENEILTDCKFLVGRKDHKKEIAAHRLILASASPVFETMFYGSLPETGNPILIPDVHPITFKLFLEYIYTDQIQIKNIGSACGLYHLASKYMLPVVTNECSKFLCNSVNVKNVLRLYEVAELFDLENLKSTCLRVISQNTQNVLNQPNFLEISMSTLMTILDQNKLNINSELDLFNALDRFAKKRVIFENNAENSSKQDKVTINSCNEIETIFFDYYDNFGDKDNNSNMNNLKVRQNHRIVIQRGFIGNSSLHKDIQNMNINETKTKKLVFDENEKSVNVSPTKQMYTEEAFRDVVKKIRFLTMTPQQFANGPAVSKLLKPNESLAFFINISNPLNSNTPVPEGFCKSVEKRSLY